MGWRAARWAGAVAFAVGALLMAAWTGAYWGAALDPVDASAGALLLASVMTAMLSAGFGTCAWVLVRPGAAVRTAWTAVLIVVAFGFFVYRWKLA